MGSGNPDPAGFARPSLTGGAQAAESLPSYRKPVRTCAFDKLESCIVLFVRNFLNLTACATGKKDASPRKRETGSTTWFWNYDGLNGGACVEAHSGHEFFRHLVLEAHSGPEVGWSAVPSKPQAAVQQLGLDLVIPAVVPGPLNCGFCGDFQAR
jgi:hypothetical protein